MRFTITALLVACSALAVAGAAQATFVVSYEGEAAGVQNTTATFSVSGVETFDEQPVHAYPSTIATTFGTSGVGSKITGTYVAGSGSGIQVNAADQYGGAGGVGNYVVAFPNTPYSLSLTSDVAGGVNYFGFWLSALDKGNFVTFYGAKGQTLFTFNPADAIAAINASANPSEYYGNPTANFKGQDGGEPFVFLNFFDTGGHFSKVAFSEVNFGGGYESDNHTVGHYLTMGQGTTVPLINSTQGVPEPTTWALLLLGFGGVGSVARARRRQSAVIA